jgi:AcrR family transcriptional regulator
VKPAVNEQDPRVRRTRKLLLDTFAELLGEKSFDAITVQDIADRSTINRATFYAHYTDKFDLFDHFAREWFRKALAASLPADAGLSRDNMRRLALTTMNGMAELQDHCRPTESMRPLLMAAVQEEIAALLARWLSSTGQLPTSVVGASWAIFGAALTWSQSDPRPPADATAGQIAAFATDALGGVAAAA